MLNINQIKTAVTHSGKFHTDDVMSTVFIRQLNPNIQILRKEELDESDMAFDVLCYDIGLGEFDHHQKDNGLDRFGNPYSSFGKLWECFGKQYLKDKGFKKIDEAFYFIEKRYATKINEGDNKGYKHVKFFFENDLIVKFNPNWFEINKDINIVDESFFKAVDFGEMIFNNWIRNAFEEVELAEYESEVFNEALSNKKDGIIYLKERINWHPKVKTNNCADVKFIITKNLRGKYSVVSRDSEKYKVKENEYLLFTHNSGFMGVAETIEDAYKAARLSLV